MKAVGVSAAIPLIGGLCFLCVILSPPAHGAVNLGQIMPLGDSITDGFNIPPGYREYLYHLLTDNGYSFQFAGSSTDRSSPTLDAAGQQHHEGHSGYVIRDLGTSPGTPFTQPFTPAGGIADNLNTWLNPCDAPNANYILLMIGTNDIAFHYFPNGPNNNGVDNTQSRLDELITQISSPVIGLRPNSHLIVASITNTPDAGNRQNFADFAAAVPGIVAAHQARGEKVSFVDMFDALDPNTDFADYVHPGPSGYQKMAQVWYDGIVAAAGAGGAAGAAPLTPEPGALGMMAALGASALLSRRRPKPLRVRASNVETIPAEATTPGPSSGPRQPCSQ